MTSHPDLDTPNHLNFHSSDGNVFDQTVSSSFLYHPEKKQLLKSVKIGQHTTVNNIFLAPMAGITDRPFRVLCKSFGAGYAISEMVASNSLLYGSVKTRRRAEHSGEAGPIAVQLVGSDPRMLADAAKYNVDLGAQIIDFNMGCPAKKICNVMAGSALMQNEALVGRILDALVKAVDIPITLKIRSGWDSAHKNAETIAKIAESAGIQMLTVHGRTRACGYSGEAEYETVTKIKSSLSIPVIANGDITTPEKAAFVLDTTGVDGIMIGRAAEGNPWIFRDIVHYLTTGERLPHPSIQTRFSVLKTHLDAIYELYGDDAGSKVARKHISWYTRSLPDSAAFRRMVNALPTKTEQLACIDNYFETILKKSTFEETVAA